MKAHLDIRPSLERGELVRPMQIQAKREELVKWLPKGGTVAEIGVAAGYFSEYIRKYTQPEMLHLIDPWTRQSDPNSQTDPANSAESTQRANLNEVLDKFNPYGNVIVHRCFSSQAASFFNRGIGDSGYFDWIYIDGNHSYQAVKDDLERWSGLVVLDGFILGHDYATHEWAVRSGVETVKAVDEFVEFSEWEMVALTVEEWPTYILARESHTEALGGGVRLLDDIEKGLKGLHGQS